MAIIKIDSIGQVFSMFRRFKVVVLASDASSVLWGDLRTSSWLSGSNLVITRLGYTVISWL